MIVIAAAGNEVGTVVWPARYDEVVAVAGCNIDKREWLGSSRGSTVDITAPGESVWCARKSDTGDTAERGNGTSFSAATLAGIAALWVGHHGSQALRDRYAPEQIPVVFRQLLKQTANQENNLPDRGFGAGIVDALALLQAPLPAPETVVVPPPSSGDRNLLEALTELNIIGLAEDALSSLSSSQLRELAEATLAERLRGNRSGAMSVELLMRRGLSSALQAVFG